MSEFEWNARGIICTKMVVIIMTQYTHVQDVHEN